MKFYIRHSIANIEIDERKVNYAIAEWGKLKSAIDSFLLAAKRYQFDPSSKSTVDAAFSTLRSEFLTRTKAGDDPPRLLRILEQRVYPTIVLMDMTLTIGDLR